MGYGPISRQKVKRGGTNGCSVKSILVLGKKLGLFALRWIKVWACTSKLFLMSRARLQPSSVSTSGSSTLRALDVHVQSSIALVRPLGSPTWKNSLF